MHILLGIAHPLYGATKHSEGLDVGRNGGKMPSAWRMQCMVARPEGQIEKVQD